LKVPPLPRSKVHTVTGDAAQVRALLAWAKSECVEMTSVSVGNCRVELRQAVTPAPTDRPAFKDPRQAIYEQFGGEAYKRMTGAVPDTGVRGEDWQPALGNEQ
jgi:hypothetical protein